MHIKERKETDLSIFLRKYFCRISVRVISAIQWFLCDGMHPEPCSVDSVYPIQSGSRSHYPNKRRVNEILTDKEGDCKPAMNTMRQKIIRPAPSEISYKEMRFLITDRPTDQTITNFIEVCPTYVSFYTRLMRLLVIMRKRSLKLHQNDLINLYEVIF